MLIFILNQMNKHKVFCFVNSIFRFNENKYLFQMNKHQTKMKVSNVNE